MPVDLAAVLARPHADTSDGALDFFAALIDAIRPRDPHRAESAAQTVVGLQAALTAAPEHRQTVRHHLRVLLGGTQQVRLYTDAGILPNSGFFSELWRRGVARVLPEVPNPTRLKDCVDEVFHHRDDHVWLAAMPVDGELALWELLFADSPEPPEDETWVRHTETQLLEAMQVLATRIGAMGLEPELTRVLPRIDEFESPFIRLGAEVLEFTESWRARHVDPAALQVDELQLVVLADQCRVAMAHARHTAAHDGASLSLTYLLVRAEQCLARLIALTGVLTARFQPEPRQVSAERWTRLLEDLVQGETRRHNVTEPFRRLTGLVALRVTDNARKTGEHYIATTRSEYLEMWRSAAGGGLVVALIALFKLLLGAFPLGPLAYTWVYGLNYAVGFVAIHVLGFTVATKQPAMTAATVAASIDASAGKTQDLHRLADLVVATVRTQLAAIAGNVAVAVPTALAIAGLVQAATRRPMLEPEVIHHVVHDLSPLTSLALPHAALTGALLFLASLISGWCDNMAAYNQVAARVSHLSWLKRLLGADNTRRFGEFLGRNLGGVLGNAVLGFMLAAVVPLGEAVGLPLGGRHVTLSAASFGFAVASLGYQVDVATLFTSSVGILLIGLTNLSVSFSLALWIALKARGADASGGRGLMRLLWARLRATPSRFVWPPPDPVLSPAD